MQFLQYPLCKRNLRENQKDIIEVHYKNSFQVKQTLKSIPTATKPGTTKDKKCIYRIPCDCDESYVGKAERPIIRTSETHNEENRRNRALVPEQSIIR